MPTNKQVDQKNKDQLQTDFLDWPSTSRTQLPAKISWAGSPNIVLPGPDPINLTIFNQSECLILVLRKFTLDVFIGPGPDFKEAFKGARAWPRRS